MPAAMIASRPSVYQAEQRDQQEAAEHHPDDPAQRVERHDGAHITTDMPVADAQPQCQRESCAQQQGRHKHNAQRRHGKTCAHADQFTGAHRPQRFFGKALRQHQPATEQGDLQQCDQPGTGNQQPEHTPRITNALDATGEQGAAEEQPAQVSGEDHGKRIGAGAHELHDRLRPDHFVAQRHAAGDGVQPQRGAIRGFLRMMFDRGNRYRQVLTLQPQRTGGGQQIEHRGKQRATAHTEVAISTNAASRVPTIAPNVFAAYN